MLVVEGGPDGEDLIPLGPKTTMGREPANDVVVPEPGVSRSHAEIVKSDKGFGLRDLQSTNGTFVNQERISDKEHILQDGDTIRLGASKVLVLFRHSAAETIQMTLVQPTVPPTSLEETVKARPEASQEPSAEPPAAHQDKDDEVYEGSVRLNVQVDGNMGLVVNFVQQVRDRPELRLLRLTNNRSGGVDVFVGLREPVPIRRIISGMEGVSHVSEPGGRDLSPESEDPPLTVRLRLEEMPEDSSPSWSFCVKCKEPLEPGVQICPACRAPQA